MADDIAPTIPEGFEKVQVPSGFEPAPATPSATPLVPRPGLTPEENASYQAAVDKALQHTQPGALVSVLKDSFAPSVPLGISEGTTKELTDLGIFPDYARGEVNLTKTFVEGILRPAAVVADTVLRGVNTATVGAVGTVGAGIDLAKETLGMPHESPEMNAYHAQQFVNDLGLALAVEGVPMGNRAMSDRPIPPSSIRQSIVATKPWQAEIPTAEETTREAMPVQPPITNLPAVGSVEAKAAETIKPTNPNDPIIHTNPILDGSGNLNLNYIRADQDTKDIMAKTAESYDQRYGNVVTHVETKQQGDAAFDEAMKQTTNGIPDVLMNYQRGGRINTDDVWIARQVSTQLGVDFAKASKAAEASGLPEDRAAAEEAFNRMVPIVGPIRHEMTATAGRILNSFQIPVGDEATGMTDEAAKKLAGMRMDDAIRIAGTLDTPQAVAKFVTDVQKPSFVDMGLYYIFNNYLSGPMTHLAYTASWGIETVLRAGIDTPIAATIGKVQKALGRTLEPGEVDVLNIERKGIVDRLAEADRVGSNRPLTAIESQTMQTRLGEISDRLKNTSTVMPHEAAARFYGIGEGALDSIKAGWRALKSGDVQALPGEMKKAESAAKDAEAAALKKGMTAEDAKKAGQAAYRDNAINFGNPIVDYADQMKNPIAAGTVRAAGQVIGGPMRFIAAIHSVQRFSGYAENINALAYRQAAMEGLEGGRAAMRDDSTALGQRIAAIKNNPSEEMMKQARDDSNKAALMGKSGWVGQKFQDFANASAWTRTIVPFSKVATNLTAQKILERTPVGLLSPVNLGKILGNEGNAEQATAIARMTRGSVLLTGGAYLAAKGASTGWTDDKNERDFQKRLGNQSYSVNIGDLNLPHRFFGVNGGSLSLGADIHEINQYIDENDLGWKDWFQTMGTSIHYIGKDILSENALKGPADLYNAIDDRENAAKYYVPNAIASAFVPYSSFQSQINSRFIDPIMRQTAGEDSYSNIMETIRSRTLFASRDLTPQIDILGQPMQRNSDHTEAMNNPIFQAMDSLRIYPSRLQPKLFGVNLDEKQFAVYSTLAGKDYNDTILPKVTDPNWVQLSNKAQADIILGAVKTSRAKAKSVMSLLYPQIIKDSAEQKQDLLHQYDNIPAGNE